MKNRELLESATKNIIGICNDIYTQIDRGTKDSDDMTECDWELVGLFNKLVAINQKNLDALYPDREAGEPKYLRFKFANENGDIKYPKIKLSSDIAKINDEFCDNTKDVWVEDTNDKYEGEVALMFANLFNKE
tara:strand:+ start:3493 stop:3891 length:399 start_codon:yes stop_codon:yes gene_type:complete